MRFGICAIFTGGLLLAAPTSVAASPQLTDAAQPPPRDDVVVSVGPLRDLLPEVANPTDGASAALVATGDDASMRHRLVVWNLASSSAGNTFGVHVHVGPCVPGNGDAAGPHFNTGGPPSPTTEVWLDFTVAPGGAASSRTTTPFVIPVGAANSLVVHENPTDDNGDAGDRIACLPAPY